MLLCLKMSMLEKIPLNRCVSIVKLTAVLNFHEKIDMNKCFLTYDMSITGIMS